MFHFGWFVGKGYSPHGWNQPWTGNIGTDWMQPDIYMDLARGLERACFDCLVIEDGSFVPDAFQGSPEWYLRNGYGGAEERSSATWSHCWLRDQAASASSPPSPPASIPPISPPGSARRWII